MSLGSLNPVDAMLLNALASKGRKTKLQLLSLGFKPWMIIKLVKYGILIVDHDTITNLRYYRVSNEYLFESDGQ